MSTFCSQRTGLLAIAFSLIPAAPLCGASPNGVPNFQTVNDRVYRGGQPSVEGFQNLAKMGIKTIVDLRQEDDDRLEEKKAVSALGMQYLHIPMRGMRTPAESQISEALKVLNSAADAPVFVHCRRGKDRTGVVIAVYRVQHDGWENGRALKEARGLGMAWYQFPLQRYVSAYPSGHAPSGGFAGTAAGLVEKAVQGVTGVWDRVVN